MAKYLKSLFQPSEKKKRIIVYEVEGEDGAEPPLDGRRKLSISRSGRLKQANRKRHSLTLELYGDDMQAERQKTVEYHVNPLKTETASVERRHSYETELSGKQNRKPHAKTKSNTTESQNKDLRIHSIDTSVEKEIDSAFEIIDKT